jgi:hypothetical protein
MQGQLTDVHCWNPLSQAAPLHQAPTSHTPLYRDDDGDDDEPAPQQHNLVPHIPTDESGSGAQLAPSLTLASGPVSADEQLEAAPATVHNQFDLAAAEVLPVWGPDCSYLKVPLPQSMALACKGVRLEIGGSLLPARCFDSLWLQPSKHQRLQYEVAGLYSLKPLLQGAELLPCKATLLQGSDVAMGRGSHPHWELVLRVRWPLAPVGQKVTLHGWSCGCSAAAHGTLVECLQARYSDASSRLLCACRVVLTSVRMVRYWQLRAR